MTSLISIRLDENLLRSTKNKARLLHLSQTEYIRRAIEQMNKKTEQLARRRRLKHASLRVRKESLKINTEFDDVEYDPKI
ncbi:MAG: hypothetical protein ACD_42C00043G0003 [uncultured bacterium]|nr:MAG: hypothetical protein ACD_42C00043G0003 [uncultured bacterium]OGT34104.1 MAG: hypothetical protein A3C44_04695 [Gammaproteobacteria bacterium RIFCSPHIGHO2_02_FULL_39_13]OGT50429.1 MAG: hypothetical protein A3E53_04510 [Gammaproteobacteria bacterium RIFCSPHIGHO2_12_FULL_39_24]